jgi:hypothetical protein
LRRLAVAGPAAEVALPREYDLAVVAGEAVDRVARQPGAAALSWKRLGASVAEDGGLEDGRDDGGT